MALKSLADCVAGVSDANKSEIRGLLAKILDKDRVSGISLLQCVENELSDLLVERNQSDVRFIGQDKMAPECIQLSSQFCDWLSNFMNISHSNLQPLTFVERCALTPLLREYICDLSTQVGSHCILRDMLITLHLYENLQQLDDADKYSQHFQEEMFDLNNLVNLFEQYCNDLKKYYGNCNECPTEHVVVEHRKLVIYNLNA